ncbi:MAG TPA: hypothetical protein VIY30_14645 [Burkholderiaceae bacterium]
MAQTRSLSSDWSLSATNCARGTKEKHTRETDLAIKGAQPIPCRWSHRQSEPGGMWRRGKSELCGTGRRVESELSGANTEAGASARTDSGANTKTGTDSSTGTTSAVFHGDHFLVGATAKHRWQFIDRRDWLPRLLRDELDESS